MKTIHYMLTHSPIRERGPNIESWARPSWAVRLLLVVGVAIIYYGAARLGLLLAFEQTNASPVWPPSGIAFAAVLLLGYRVWPGIMAGAFLANVVVFLANQSAAAPSIVAVSSAIAVGNTLEAVSGALLFHRLVRSGNPLAGTRDGFRFVVVALLMCAVSATIGPTSLSLAGLAPWKIYATIWFTWWLGDVAGVLILTPMLLAWWQQPRLRWQPQQLGETTLLFLMLLVSQAIFGGWMPAGSVSSQAYVILPFLLWAVFRFGSREATMAVVLVSGLAIWGTVHGYGPFIRESLNESLLLLQAFVCVIAITVMALAGALAERRQAEEALARQAQKLARSNAELEQFAYVVSHDLRAPLRALNNYSLFLQEDCAGQLDETGLEYIQGIVESVQQMDALVVDLLEYSRIGRTAIELSAVDAGELLERVVTRLGLREQAEVRLPADLPTIQARELRLEQIFSNLLSNAVKFHRASATPVIAVECADRGEVWEFSVRDNGIGIHEKHFERIFGLFQRLHTSEEYEGTGIGLAIVKKAVEEHGGQVRVQSTPGEGSIFTFTLPKHIKEA